MKPNIKEENYDSFLHRLYGQEKSDFEQNVFNITFQVTDDCNLKCSYCYQIHKGHNTMPLEVAKKFIDLLLNNDEMIRSYVDINKKRAVVLDFIGGDPFLEVELIDQIIDYFITQVILRKHHWQYNYRISISSNGTLYFTPKVQEFIKKHQGHISLSFSVDGDKQTHDACRKFPNGDGSYDLAIAAAKHYQKYYDGYLGSKITISPENIDFLSNGIISLFNEGYEYI